jgi:signal transduction histidine kinase
MIAAQKTLLDNPPCWMQETGRCEKGFEGRFLTKVQHCVNCEVFAREAARQGASPQAFMVEQLLSYDQYIITELQRANFNLKQKVDELSVLLDISTLMQGTTDLDEILYIILSGLTAGFAMGFNRALLFLVDDSRKELAGKLGVGPASGEEANLIWTSMSHQPASLSRMITPEAIQTMKTSPMTVLVQNIRKPLIPGIGILTQTVLDKKAYLISDAFHDPRVNQEVLNLLKCSMFATVPLLAKDKAIGVIYVDNMYSRDPITEDDLGSLTRFATLAGLAIAETMAYEQIEHFNEQLEAEVARAKEELQAKERELAHKEKLVALGQMAAGVAHELRNPMTAVRGFAQRIYRRLPDTDRNKKYASIIMEEMDRINQLIKDVLDYARKGEPLYELNNVHELLEDVLFLFRDSLLQYPIEIDREYGSLKPFYFDSGQMQQVFTNIISNAIDVLRTGGKLTLRTRQEGDWVFIDIEDTGPGIWPEILKDIFNPFFTTKGSGTGLGLSIADRIAESHGGDILVKSKVGQGSVFTVKLPYRLMLDAAMPEHSGT